MNLQTSPSTTLPAMPRKRSKPPRSVTATGSRQTRIKKARHYLGKRAWVPTNPADRNNSLLIVMCNLRLYLQLNEAAARRGTVIEAARSIKTASAEG